MTAGNQLGIGVVGAGRWAGLAHLPGWARDERCRIVGVCDREPERAAAAADQYGAAVVTTDYRVLLNRDDIDLIDVVTRDRVNSGRIQVASLEGYGAPVIDIGHWFMESDLTAVVGVLRNFVPERMIAATGAMARTNIDDGDIFIGEFASGAICSVQSSFVTVGNYPGIEVRVYGSEGAAIARLVEESGICETLKLAKPDDVEFRDVEVPARYYPPGGSPRESWRTLYYANLTANFASEVLGEIDGNEGNFDDGLRVQEVINAVEISHHERRWVSLPLDQEGGAGDGEAAR